MKISYKWLKEILDFNLDSDQTSALLTDIGLEVERQDVYENIKGGLKGLIIGEVKSVEKHPNADRLNITQVDLGEDKNYTIVCGAPNVKKGQKVIVAKPGTTIYPKNNSSFEIKNAKIRGQDSFGMICAEDEIGIGDGHDGILVLDKDANIGDSAANYFSVVRDTIFEIGLTPNRADAMSHYGVARDLLAALKFKKLLPLNSSLKAIPEKSQIETRKNIEISISIEDSDQCQRYTGIVIKNIKVKPSPKWLKDKLESIGIKPINNIVDVTNYVLHYYGQPLHAFDLDKIIGKEIKVRTPKDKTLFTTLDGQERKLDKEDIMICNSEKEMCLAGVFGGLDSGVTEKTKTIFIESALFNPVLIRKTAKRHGLNTDASFRYERGVDPSMVLPALIKASEIIKDLSGGEIASEILDVHPKETKDISFEINFEKIRKIGGIKLDNKTITDLLTHLEIKVDSINTNKALVSVPAYRNDVTREIDIAEEVLRIYGYNNIDIPEKINSSPSIPKLKSNHSIQQKISNHLVSLGGYEIMNNSLVKREYGNFLDEKSNNHISLLNPLSNDTATLRKSLIYGAVEVLKFNHFNGNPNGIIFEWGKVYSENGNKYDQENRLLIATTGLQNEEHWFNGKLESSFFQLKGIIESVFKSLGIYYETEMLKKDHLWEEGLSLTKGKYKLATVGTVRKEISNLIGFKKHYFISEIYFDNLMKVIANSKPKIKPINKFQKVYRDLSILIPEDVTMQEIKHAIDQLKSKLLKNTTLFDIYRDKKNIGKKAYGLRFEFLHSERTLKDQEVDSVMNSIQSKLEDKFNAALR
jgi:phenylalanyl-tRNA synthetase beta chain